MPAKINNAVLFLVCLLLAYGCGGPGSLSPDEYKTAIGSGKFDLAKLEVFGRIRYVCRLQTPEMITLARSGKQFETQADFESEKKNYADQLSFTILIEDEENSGNKVKSVVHDAGLYAKALAYANSIMQNDLSLALGNNEIIPCSMVHLEPANAIQPVVRISVSFANVNLAGKGCTLVFNDNFFNNGRIKFSYNKELFESLPQLKI